MAKNYKDYSYFDNRPDVVKLFDDIEAYQNYCRLELIEFNPADIITDKKVKFENYPKNYQNFLNSNRPRRPYLGKNPRYPTKPRHEQHFSR